MMIMTMVMMDELHVTIKPYVADNRDFRHSIQNVEPNPDVLCSVSNRSPNFIHELIRVDTNLEDVVRQSEERCKRKRSDEDGDEAELENCWNKGGVGLRQRAPHRFFVNALGSQPDMARGLRTFILYYSHIYIIIYIIVISYFLGFSKPRIENPRTAWIPRTVIRGRTKWFEELSEASPNTSNRSKNDPNNLNIHPRTARITRIVIRERPEYRSNIHPTTTRELRTVSR